MRPFSRKTAFILSTAGWQENRKIDVTHSIRQLEQEGYIVFPTVRTFLEQFGGLILRRPDSGSPRIVSWLDFILDVILARSQSTACSRLDLRVAKVLQNFKRWEAEAFGEELNVTLCPVGEDSDAVIYVMDKEGKVYGLYRPFALFIGDSGEQAIERYCTWDPANPYETIVDLSDED